MLFPAALAASMLALQAIASPVSKREMAEYRDDVEIHESCNTTQHRQIEQALKDTYEVAQIASNYIVANGVEDPVYQLYFGKGNMVTALGAYEGILRSNKMGVLLRCDNPDGNCGQDGWNGHWRGENGTSETVICDLSYETRRFNVEFCNAPFTVAGSSPSYYWSTDLLHRLWHVPSVSGNGTVAHFADSYQDCLELAKTNPEEAVINTHSLQYFASHIFANEVAAPGGSCIGEPKPEETAAPAYAASSAAVSTASAAAATATVEACDCHCHGPKEHCSSSCSASAIAEAAAKCAAA